MAQDPDKLKEYRKEFKKLMADELNRLKTAEEVNKNMDSYFQSMENARKAQQLINQQSEEILKIEQKIKELKEDENELDEEKIKFFEEQVKKRKQQVAINQKNLNIQKQEANLLKATLGTLKEKTQEIYKANFALDKMYSYLTDIDGAIKSATLSMGLVGENAGMLRDNMYGAASFAATLGVSMEELGRATENYSKELGLASIPSQQLLEDFAEIARGTGASVEDIGRFAGTLSKAGIPASRMKSVMQDVVDSSAEMGLNVSAVESSLRDNVTLMNRLHFKDGINGLTKMIQVSERFRLNVSEIASLSEKIFRPEGAIELAANLQMMGGEFSRLGDPLTLMYKARNAPEELAKSIGKAAAESAIFNKQTGEFKMSALEMDRLRQISEATGMSMESLVEAGKRAAKESQIAGKLAFNVSDKDKALLSSAAEFNKKTGGFEIKLPGGDMVAMKDLTKAQLEAISDNKKSLEERAKSAQTFDDAFNNLINTVKTFFIPLIDVLNVLIGPLQSVTSALAGLGPWGKGFAALLITAFGVGGQTILAGLTSGLGKISTKISNSISERVSGSGDIAGDVPDGKGQKGSGFMKQLRKMDPKQMLALGGAFMLIGAGVGLAAAGLSLFVKSFKELSPEQTEAVNTALLGFGIAVVALTGILAALAYSGVGPAAAGVLMGLGAGMLMIGGAVALASLGLSMLVESFSALQPEQISAIGSSILQFAGGIAVLTATFAATGVMFPIMAAGMGTMAVGLAAVGAATQTINTEGVSALAASLKSINDLSDEKISGLGALFKAAAEAKPLVVVHTPVVVSGTVTLDSGDVQMDIDMESFAPKIAKRITDAVHAQNQFQRSGSTPGA